MADLRITALLIVAFLVMNSVSNKIQCCHDNPNMHCNPGYKSEKDCDKACRDGCSNHKGGFCKNHKCHCKC
ncbi:hypothetical protein DCAR_0936032 [Daucus carota subsp. sativus]|uniref:Knottin scorpion toxin-like domain-containing protein n=1 Tax=Daucus carota subsp. sativus TaxID=79200 RepID=A0AAF1BHC8_DAUCS|nr:hypothetical protein DCAR_0936032 [Daucus carota subsp. sativus]